jgi:hypothetical protein
MLKLRLTWWWVWWSFCAIGLLSYVFQTIDILRYPEHASGMRIATTGFWLVAFGWIVPNKVPKTEKILEKDLIKDPDNIYAKAILLKIHLKKKNKDSMKEKEESDLRERVKIMEDELGNMDK